MLQRSLLVAVLASLALLPPAWGQARPAGGLSNNVLKNATYEAPWVAGGEMQLKEGRFDGVHATDPRIAVRTLLIGAPARGDLNGDGLPDAAVVLATSTGGQEVYYEVAAVLNDKGKPVHVATAPIGDRIRFQWVNIRNGTIVVEFFAHGEKDPPCCPKAKTTRRFRLEPGGLREVSG
jgi:hypothetical protein